MGEPTNTGTENPVQPPAEKAPDEMNGQYAVFFSLDNGQTWKLANPFKLEGKQLVVSPLPGRPEGADEAKRAVIDANKKDVGAAVNDPDKGALFISPPLRSTQGRLARVQPARVVL